jgi:hypothetical protein
MCAGIFIIQDPAVSEEINHDVTEGKYSLNCTIGLTPQPVYFLQRHRGSGRRGKKSGRCHGNKMVRGFNGRWVTDTGIGDI